MYRFDLTHPLNNFNAAPNSSTSTAAVAAADKCKDIGDSDSNIYEQADSIYETILDSDSPYSQLPSQPPPLPDPNILTKGKLLASSDEPQKASFCGGSDSNGYSIATTKDFSKRCPSPVDYSIVNPSGAPPMPECDLEYATVNNGTLKPCELESGDDYVPMYDDGASLKPAYQNVTVDKENDYQVPRAVVRVGEGQEKEERDNRPPPDYANFVPAMKTET